MMNEEKIKNIIILSLVILFVVSAYKDCSARTKMKSRKKQTTAKVIDAYGAYRGGLAIDYSYTTPQGELTGGSTNKNINGSNPRLFIGKTFPLVYDSVNPKYSDILILEEEFRAYSIKFPDSLKWVNRYRR